MDDVKIFSDSIKKLYIEKLLRREKRWPPCNESEHIKLKLCYSSDNQKLKGKVAKEIYVDYANLFKMDDNSESKKTIRKILVEGDAGIGKTTLCNVISEEWANKKILEQYELLLYLPLRQNGVASATTLPDVLKILHSCKEIRISVGNYLEKSQGESTLIIADGWDELSDSERQERSFLYKLLFGELLPFISVLLTSRPFASAPFHDVQFIDRHIKIRGFDKENIENYVVSQFAEDMVGSVIEQLKSNPQLESICSIPLNCAIFCYMWHSASLIPSTMTELYRNITAHVIWRNIKKKIEPGNRVLFSTFDSLPEPLQKSWWLQCEFAYQALKKNQLVFTSESQLADMFPEGHETILSFGLMQSTYLPLIDGHGISFYFIHPTFREFLAALHLERQPSNRKIKICYEHSKSKKFALVWRFFFGICFTDSNKLKYKLEDEKEALRLIINSLAHDRLTQYHCALEAKNKIINDEITYEKHHPCTAYDCMAISYVIANCQSESSAPLEIDFSNCSLGDKLITSVANTLTKAGDHLCVKELFLDENGLSGNGISNLFNEAPSFFRSLKLLSLSQNPLGSSGFMELEQVISADKLPNLRYLYLQGSLELVEDVAENHLSVSFWKALTIHCPKLNIVNLVESEYIDHFDLEGISLGLEGAVYVCKILSNDVQDEDYDYAGYIDLSSCQLTATEFPNTSLSFNSASKEILEMPKNRSISFLLLDKNNFTGDRIYILAGLIHLCPRIESLFTRECKINSNDIKKLLSQPIDLNHLERWALDGNQIEDDGVEAFVQFRHSLRVDNEGITFHGNPLSRNKIKWLKDQEGQCLSKIDTLTSDQAEVDLYYDDSEQDHEDGDADDEDTDDNLSDEEQSNDPNYSPSRDLQENEESSESDSGSSMDEDTTLAEDDPLSSQDRDDRASSSGESEEPSSQDIQSMESEDESYLQDSDESSSEDESEDTKASTLKLIVSIDISKIKLQRLKLSDLAKVREAVWEVRSKWYDLGLDLKISPDTLDTIREDHRQVVPCFIAMLKEWLKCGHATWHVLTNALRGRCIGYADLADQLPPK